MNFLDSRILLLIIIVVQFVHSKSIFQNNSGNVIQEHSSKSLLFEDRSSIKHVVRKKRPILKRQINMLQNSGFGLIQNDLLDKYKAGQSHMAECMPGSIFYNGTCIYFSSKHQKLSWLHSERFCRRLPLDTSFLTIKNDHQFEQIRKEIVKIAQRENPVDQLVFFIGFRFYLDEWKWVNNQSLKNTNLTLGKYWWDWTGSHGDCGSLALLKTNELVMRSAPCLSTHGRFMCQYTLDPCYQNDICGKCGRCVNLYAKFYCDCSVTIFYEGKYCEKWNKAMIQTIIGSVLIVLLFGLIFFNTSFFVNWWNKNCGKRIKSHNEELRRVHDLLNRSTHSLDDINEYEKMDSNLNHPIVKFSNENPSQLASSKSNENKKIYHSLSQKITNLTQSIKKRLEAKTNKEISTYLLQFVLTTFFTSMQLIIIHDFVTFKEITKAKNSTTINYMCNLLEENFLLEELIYLIPALMFFIILWFYHRQRRFNKYIMVKFKHYFTTSIYKNLREEQKKKHAEAMKIRAKKLKNEKNCGECQYGMYKCFKNGFCRVFCCLFCCSCCVPPGSNNRCFICYCCWQGWKQTDFYRVLKGIKKVLYYLCCCYIWKRLWKLTLSERQRRKEKKQKLKREREKRRIRLEKEFFDGDLVASDDEDIDLNMKTASKLDIMEDDLDVADFNDNQEFKTTTFPFPQMPFSTSNRTQSSAVYVIYTYDVLNIFMYIYTANMSTVDIPFFGRPNGVLFDFAIQIIHVLLIGIKFYPILIVADMDPYAVVYFSAALYMLIIWTLKLFTKGFCSRTEAFVKRTLKKLSTDVGYSYDGGKLKNATKNLIGLFSEDPSANQKYLEALKNGIPSVFKEYFGKYSEDDAKNIIAADNEDLMLTDANTLGYSTPNRYYLEEVIGTTTTPATTTTIPYNYQGSTYNSSNSGKSIIDIFTESNSSSMMFVNIFENLPLYLTLSFLLSRYIILFFGVVIDFFVSKCTKKYEESNSVFDEYVQAVQGKMNISNENKRRIVAGINRYLNSNLDYVSESNFTKRIREETNHNYNYIQRLTARIKFFDYKSGRSQKYKNESNIKKKITKQVSWVWFFIENYIYKNVPYMKYSKQFINTYTVAFMIVYFFTLFGFRLSNIFGSTIVVTIELIYRFIFRGMIPTFNFDDHNFNAEFRITCLFTSFVVCIQLLCSVRSFHRDLLKLHKGGKLVGNSEDKTSFLQDGKIIQRERYKASSAITADSLHFPGYLIAHLVYGYGLLFVVFFCCMISIKLLLYFPKVLQTSSQIVLPLVILVSLKFIVIHLATKIVFLREDGQRITNLAPYYTISYFNFFFDCFLGLVATMSRVWQTTVVSLLALPRLDKSMFNKDSDLLMRRLDKGHLSYINYVRMEHWYNNCVVNGFCEMLIESMLYSQIYKAKYITKALHNMKIVPIPTDPKKCMLQIERSISQQPKKVQHSFNHTNKYESVIQSPTAEFFSLNSTEITFKNSNPHFKYSSFLRLRNLFFLCLLLKANPKIRKLRHHYLMAMGKNEDKSEQEVIGPNFNSRLNKIFKKAKEKITGSSVNINKPATVYIYDQSYTRSDEIDDDISETSQNDYKFDRTFDSYLKSPPSTIGRTRRVSF